jgi:ectoine hydroxylase-related dioxygenase (phytanoyl-CoA dioxygenase family)
MSHDFPSAVTNASELAPGFGPDGYEVIEDAIGADVIEQLRSELAPYLDGRRMGRNDFEGTRSERVYRLLAKAPTVARLIEHPAVLDVVGRCLHPSFLLSAALVVNLHPGETPQDHHQDDALGAPPPPRAPQGVSTIWALDAFTTANGATEVIPGSHRWDRAPRADDRETLERLGRPLLLRPGSVAIFPGTLYHRSGANRSRGQRLGLTIQYCQPWLRQLENMMLATPPELAARYSTRIQELVGYSLVAGTFVGYVDGRHPRKLIPDDGDA